MKIIDTANNGVVVNSIKTYDELSQAERETLIIPFGSRLEDFANFQVRYNKKGELLGINGYDFTNEAEENININGTQARAYMDLMTLRYSKNTHAKHESRERLKKLVGVRF